MRLPESISEMLSEAVARVMGRGLRAEDWRRVQAAGRAAPRAYVDDDPDALLWTCR